MFTARKGSYIKVEHVLSEHCSAVSCRLWEIVSVKVMWCFDILSTVNNADVCQTMGKGEYSDAKLFDLTDLKKTWTSYNHVVYFFVYQLM